MLQAGRFRAVGNYQHKLDIQSALPLSFEHLFALLVLLYARTGEVKMKCESAI